MTATSLPGRPSGIAVLSLPSAVFFAGVMGVSAWLNQPLVVFLSGLILAVAGISRGWSRLSVARLSYRRKLSSTHAFPGETVSVSVSLDNRKILPLTWVETTDPLPKTIEGDLGLSTALLWYQRATRERTIECRRRGYYPIGPARVATGDIFGLFPRERSAAEAESLTVYPRLYPIGAFGLPSRHPLGESRAASKLFEDPSRAMGLREYTPDTPFRHIHWKASARHRELQVKVFEPSATVKTAVFLDVGGLEGEPFELAASVAASLAHHLTEAHQAVGLYANAVQADGHGCPSIAPATGTPKLMEILEALAKIDPPGAEPFSAFLDHRVPTLAWGTTICLITGTLETPVVARLLDLHRSGYQPVVLFVGDGEAVAGRIPIHRIRTPDDLESLT